MNILHIYHNSYHLYQNIEACFPESKIMGLNQEKCDVIFFLTMLSKTACTVWPWALCVTHCLLMLNSKEKTDKVCYHCLWPLTSNSDHVLRTTALGLAHNTTLHQGIYEPTYIRVYTWMNKIRPRAADTCPYTNHHCNNFEGSKFKSLNFLCEDHFSLQAQVFQYISEWHYCLLSRQTDNTMNIKLTKLYHDWDRT